MRAAIAVAVLLLAGCDGASPSPNPSPAPAASLAPTQKIMISYGVCYGSCPMFEVTVSATGQGSFEGQAFTMVKGKRVFPVSGEQFAAVASALEPIRRAQSVPVAEVAPAKGPACDGYVTDNPSRILVWTEAGGAQRAMVWDTGCKAKRYDGTQAAIDKALAVLPVGPWMAQAD